MLLLSPESLRASAQREQADLDRMARAVEEKLIAPCCFMQTLANHSSPKADELKREIRDLLQQGRSEEEVLQYFLDTYGERILAVPQPRGFNMLAYFVPPLLVLVAAVGMALWIRRHTARPSTARPPADEVPPRTNDPALVERMRAELANFE